MTSVTDHLHATDSTRPPIPLLDERPHRAGPVTAWLLRRTVLCLLVVEAAATEGMNQ